MNQDIRWKQRFQNYHRAFLLLQEALADGTHHLSALEKEGAIQRFEYSFELAWKSMKDYLEESGLVISPLTPRQVLKEAFTAKIIRDGQLWLEILAHRNLLSHTYDFAVFDQAIEAIHRHYLPALAELNTFFLTRNES